MSGVTAASVLYLLSGVISLAAAAAVWQRRQARGAGPLAGMLTAAAVWAICDAVEVHLATVAGRRLASQVQYLGVIAAAPFFIEAAFDLGRLDAWRRRPWVRGAVWTVPLLTLPVAWTSQWHSWLWTAIRLPAGGQLFATYEYGWWFWVLTAQHYVLMALGAAALLSASRRVSGSHRAPLMGVVVAVAVAWIGNFIYVFKIGPLPGLNWLTLSLGLSGALLAWLVVNEGLLDLVPRAREALLDTMTDAVVILDADDRVIFANPAAIDLLALPDGARHLPEVLRLPDHRTSAVSGVSERALDRPGGVRWVDLRDTVILDRWGDRAGRLIVARDITHRKALEAERERLITELRGARVSLDELERMVTLCTGCQRIRDEDDVWREVEPFLGRHGVGVTHGICPDCYLRDYGEDDTR